MRITSILLEEWQKWTALSQKKKVGIRCPCMAAELALAQAQIYIVLVLRYALVVHKISGRLVQLRKSSVICTSWTVSKSMCREDHTWTPLGLFLQKIKCWSIVLMPLHFARLARFLAWGILSIPDDVSVPLGIGHSLGINTICTMSRRGYHFP